MTKLSMSEEEMLKRKYTRPYEKRIEKLETENNKLLDVINNQDVKIADLESNFRICEKNADTYYDNLTKAKEILQLFLKLKITPCASGNSINMFQFENVCNQAEQFLKEIEK